MIAQTLSGRVTAWDGQRGHGRIVDEQDREFYVHFRALIDTDHLEIGQIVRFEGHLNRKGNIAEKVSRA